jgi:hypothetical protein
MTKTIEIPCSKCDGKGRINGFGHIENGRCFRCAGNKTFTVDAAKHAADVAKAEAGQSLYRVESELSAWTGGYGSVERVAAAIVADGGDCRGVVGIYIQHFPGYRAALIKAYRAAKRSA